MTPNESAPGEKSFRPSLNALREELRQAEDTYKTQQLELKQLETIATKIKPKSQQKPSQTLPAITFKKPNQQESPTLPIPKP